MISNKENNNYEDIPQNSITRNYVYITSRLDSLKFGKWHIFIIICLGLTWIFDGYEVSMLSLASIELKNYFKISDKQVGVMASCYLLGCVCGSLFFGYLASKFGRKKLFAITLIIYVLSIIALCCMTNYYGFLACRFFTGFL